MSDASHESSAAIAALAVCESLLIVLVEKGVLDWSEVYEALECTIDEDGTLFSAMECESDSREAAVGFIRTLLSRAEVHRVG